jgi:hypothetical protein
LKTAGGPGGNGGMDGDTKIQIVVYDINTAADGYGTIGFYSPNDLLNNAITNRAEMFYINTSSFQINRDNTVLTLVHEFQHMINYTKKSLFHNIPQATIEANLWYNEMMSMMTEDVMLNYLGLSDAKVKSRMGDFLGIYYTEAMTTFNSASYGKKWAFGSYLLRNYGGAELLSKMIANNKVGIGSITEALNEIYPGLTFEQVLLRYGEFMLLSSQSQDAGVVTFNKTVSSAIGSYTYTIPGYDIWSLERIENNTWMNRFGPLIATTTPSGMYGYSVLLHSDNAWTNKTGSFSITLNRPNSANIELFLIVK